MSPALYVQYAGCGTPRTTSAEMDGCIVGSKKSRRNWSHGSNAMHAINVLYCTTSQDPNVLLLYCTIFQPYRHFLKRKLRTRTASVALCAQITAISSRLHCSSPFLSFDGIWMVRSWLRTPLRICMVWCPRPARAWHVRYNSISSTATTRPSLLFSCTAPVEVVAVPCRTKQAPKQESGKLASPSSSYSGSTSST